jgi:hypothetical protein
MRERAAASRKMKRSRLRVPGWSGHPTNKHSALCIPASRIPVPVEDVGGGSDHLDAVQHRRRKQRGVVRRVIWIALCGQEVGALGAVQLQCVREPRSRRWRYRNIARFLDPGVLRAEPAALRHFLAAKTRGAPPGAGGKPDRGRSQPFAESADEFTPRAPVFKGSFRHRGEYYTSVNVRLKPVWLW